MHLPRFYILDTHAIVYQAQYAQIAPLTSPSGEPTKATYVFTRMLLKLIRTHQISFIAAACDSRRSDSVRKQIYPEYKATRVSQPGDESVFVQLARCKQILGALNIPVIHVPGYEADDIIATFCTATKDLPLEVVIVSRDKDLEQCLRDGVQMFDPVKEEFQDEAKMIARRGFKPYQVPHFLAIAGDSSDNIPGIKGIGEKGASDLLKKYGTIQGICEHAAELPKKMQEKLLNTDLDLMLRLTTLYDDLDLEFDLGILEWKGLDLTKARVIFRELGFQRWYEEFT